MTSIFKIKMKDTKEIIAELFDSVKDLIQTQYDILMLTFTVQLSKLVGSILGKLVFIIFMLIGIFFGSIALAFYIGSKSGDTFKGFAYVAAGYVLIGLIALFIRTSWLKKIFLKTFANQIYNNEE